MSMVGRVADSLWQLVSLSSLGIRDVEFDFGAIYWNSPLVLYEVDGVRLKAVARS